MDSGSIWLFGVASTGAIYYVLYRVVLHQRLKWKMIHSIWLPLTLGVLALVTAGGLLLPSSNEASMAEFVAIVILMVFLFPVIVFFVLFFLFSFKSKRNKSQ